jgi:hypothetical protein
MATKILINAVNGKEKSKPFVAYLTNEDAELPKQFVLRLDDTTNRNDEPQLRVSNANIGIIVSHQPEYLEGVLTGYRRKVEDTTVVICERFKDDIPSLKSLANSEVF